MKMRALSILLAALLLTVPGWPLAGEAVEYRLQVASLYNDAFFALLGAASIRGEGPVDSRLVEALDRGEVPAGAFLYGRMLEVAPARVATSFGASLVRAEARLGQEITLRGSEVRWEGTPGEHSVWVIAPVNRWETEARNVALKGTGPLVWAIPHLMALVHSRSKAVGIPLGFAQAYEGNAGLWGKYLSAALDLGEGIGVVVGDNSSSVFADHVYIVVKHAPAPTTYQVVIGWGRRLHELQTVKGHPTSRTASENP